MGSNDKPGLEEKGSESVQELVADVVIFGAGIAGLTVAHELAERNFTVAVIDPSIVEPRKVMRSPEYANPGLGGMAKSQWCYAPVDTLGGPRSPLSTAAMREALPEPTWSAIRVDYTITGRPGEQEVLFGNRAKNADNDEDRGSLTEELGLLAAYLKAESERDTKINVVCIASKFEDTELLASTIRRMIEAESPSLTVYTMQYGDETARDGTVTIRLGLFSLPGEHGFRFFPSFYRHLFDTLKRIPLSADVEGHRTRNGTVFDNLMPTQEVGYVGKASRRSVRVPRRKLRSFAEARELVGSFLDESGYTESDVALLGRSFLKYMTSSRLRREREYEDVSWYDFVEGDRYSDRARFLHETAPGTLGGLFGSAADARTQGTIACQLVKDSMGDSDGATADMLLNAPTDLAWFAHWHRYLVSQGVVFYRGELADVRADGEPIIHIFDDGAPTPVTVAPANDIMGGQSRYVVALPLQQATAKAKALEASIGRSRLQSEARDFAQLIDFVGNVELEEELARPLPRGPLRHLSGVQYFFDQELRMWPGHTQYFDAPYGLTAISQPQFWRVPEDLTSGYRTVLSVDVGTWAKPTIVTADVQDVVYGWNQTPAFLATEIWRQITEQHAGDFPGEGASAWSLLPTPHSFHVDFNLLCDEEGKICGNASPFLVNEKGRYRKRPGWNHEFEEDDRAKIDYAVAWDRYILAGTHMQTATRITSMEAANESGRRAVNALLHHLRVPGERCALWDPEDFELDAFTELKRLDRELCVRGTPHMLDILRT